MHIFAAEIAKSTKHFIMKTTLTRLSFEILKIANSELSRSVFLKEISHLLMDWLECGELKILLKIPKSETQSELVYCTKEHFDYNIIDLEDLEQHLPLEGSAKLWNSILDDNFDSSSTFFTDKGLFWTINFGNMSMPYRMQLGSTSDANPIDNDYSLLIIPFLYSNERVGLIQVKELKHEIFSSIGTEALEEFAQTLSVILNNQYTQALLLERVKELALLYKMSNITKQRSLSADELVSQVIELIPQAWQYPELTAVRITLDGQEYSTGRVDRSVHTLMADITADQKKCGSIEVIYTEKCHTLDEGPFLKEERNLLNTIAAELGTSISQKKSDAKC